MRRVEWPRLPLLPPRLGRAAEIAGRSLAVLLGLVFLTAAGGIFLLSQTVVGRHAAASFVEEALRGAVNGEVRLGPIIGGNLLTRAHVAHFEIATHDGVPFLDVDSILVEYNPMGFLTGEYRFRRARIRRARVHLYQSDEGVWNFDELFGGGGGGPGGIRLLLTDVEVETGRLTLRTPWARGLTGSAFDSAVARGLRGDAVWRVRQSGPRTYERLLELDSLRGRFPLIRVADPRRPMRFELKGIGATARVVAQPLEISRFDGSVVFRDTIAVELDRLRTTGSSLAGRGWVVPEDPPAYRFDLAAEPLGFSDLQWLPIPVPAGGGGPMDVVLRSRDEAVVVEVADGDIEVEDTRLSGSFVVALGSPPRFESLAMDMRPLRIALVDELFDRERLIDGFIDGRLSGSGPIDLLHIDAGLELRDLDGETSPSGLRARGRISVGEPNEMRGLELEFEEFEPRWASLVGIVVDIDGRARGTATLDGFAGGPLSFSADLFHQLPGDSLTHLVGDGSLDLREASSLDVSFTADPLSLSLVDPYMKGIDLVGVVRGPFSASGTLDDLRLTADLRTPRGLLNFDGRFNLVAEEQVYDARLFARDIQLRQWAKGGPETRLAVRGRVQGRGTDPRTLRATFDLEILPSLFEGARVDSSLLRFTLADGLANADTFTIRTDVGTVDGFGSFGLVEGRSGSLILDVTAPDLAEWNRWLLPGRHPTHPDTSVTDLFADFQREDDAVGILPPQGRADTLAGRLAARGVVFGNARDFAFGGRVNARDIRYGELSADSLQFTIDVSNPHALDSLVMRSHVWNAEGLGSRADSLFVRLQRLGPVRSDVEVYARRDTSLELDARGVLELAESRRAVTVDRFRYKGPDRELRLRGSALVAYGESGLFVDGLELVGGGGPVIRIGGAVPDSGTADLDVRIEALRLENAFAPWPKLAHVGGQLDATLRVRGTAASPRMEGRFRVREPEYASLVFPLLEGELRYADRRLNVRTVLRGGDVNVARVDGSIGVDLALHGVERRLLPNSLDLFVHADSTPLHPLELAFRALRAVEGVARGEVRVLGGPGDLRYEGRLTVRDGAATLPSLGVRFQEIGGGVRFTGSQAILESVTLASSAGGSAVIEGILDLSSFTNPRFDLDLRASRLGAIDSRLATLQIGGRGHLGGEYERAFLTGVFRLSEGVIRVERFLRERQAVDLTDPEVFSLIDTTIVAEERVLSELRDPFLDNVRLEVTLQMGPGLWLRSSALDMELVGAIELRLDRATDDLAAAGDLHIPRGTYTYISGSTTELESLYSRDLQITTGTISFVGTPGLDPNLDIQAEYRTRTQEVGQLTVTAMIGGTMVRPTLTTTSEPPLPESDRICYLLFASPCVGVGDQGGAFAASLLREGILGTVGSGFSQVFVSGSGVVDYLNLRSTSTLDLSEEESGGLLFAGTEVEVGRYLTPELFVRASQPLGGQLPGVSLEWQFSEGWLLEARTEERYRPLSLLSSTSNIDTDRTYGLFLFREWSF
ncbi:MAG: translocation/assembly module TamB domain-containing protein [Gemmatimonadota bacterium]